MARGEDIGLDVEVEIIFGISLLLIVMTLLLYCKLHTVQVKEMKHTKKGQIFSLIVACINL